MKNWEEIREYLPQTRQELNAPLIRCVSLDSFVIDNEKMTPERFKSLVRTEEMPSK